MRTIPELKQAVDDLQHDIVWEMQHGHERKSFDEVEQSIARMAIRVRRLMRYINRRERGQPS